MWGVGAAAIAALLAGAEDSALTLIPVILPPDASFTARAASEVVSNEASVRLGLRLVSDEELFVSGSAQQKLADCGADSPCLAAELRASGVNIGLIVMVNMLVSPPIVALRVIDAKHARVVIEDVSVLGADEEVPAALHAAAARVLDRLGYARGGWIAISADPPDARVFLDGAPIEVARRIAVAPGAHELRGVREGCADARARVNIEAGREAQVHLQLIEERTPWSSPWLWIGIGAAVIAAGAAVAIGTSSSRLCGCVGAPGSCRPDCQ